MIFVPECLADEQVNELIALANRVVQGVSEQVAYYKITGAFDTEFQFIVIQR